MRSVRHALHRSVRATLWAAAVVAMSAAGLSVSQQDSSADAATKYTTYAGGGRAGLSVDLFRPDVVVVAQGDTIEWTNPYEEIHTVTFLAGAAAPELVIPAGPPPQPGVAPPPGPPKLVFNPKVANPSAGSSFDGSAYANSGIIGKGQNWTVTFTRQGQFPFICILHPGMEATVIVQPAGSHVPTQQQRDFEAQVTLDEQLAKGEAAAAAVKPGSTRNANGSTSYDALNADGPPGITMQRFFPARLNVAVGDTVNWKNPTFVPHTVTFAAPGQQVPASFGPEPQASGPPLLVLNPATLFPAKPSQNFDGSTYVNSGFLGTGPEATGGTSFSLTFTKAGTYAYVCVLHADQGMAGVIIVGEGGGSSGGSSVRPPSTGDAGLADGGSVAAAIVIVAVALFGGATVVLRGSSAVRHF